MILFLLSLLFNPFGMLANWLPALYLAAWPIIIQTMGRETLVAHAIVLILFVLTCDVSRQVMLRLIGFDLISLPLGIALLMSLATESGSKLLSYLIPLFSSSLVIMEPIFLVIEAYIFIDIIRSLNKWISIRANIRDENSHDLSNWDLPLTRSSIFVRIGIFIATILSYIVVYLILQESKLYLGYIAHETTIPINFHHAIAALVTLQLIAVSANIYKEEGILSEPAMIAILASIPVFISSWSYYHLMKDNAASSGWAGYNLFSIFGGSSRVEDGDYAKQTSPFDYHASQELDFDAIPGNGFSRDPQGPQIDFRPLEKAFRRMEQVDSLSSQVVIPILRRLIMVINSILGLSMRKLANYYFGPDFWCFLFGRIICLSWWALIVLRRPRGAASWAGDENQDDHVNEQAGGFSNRGILKWPAKLAILPSWLPLSRKTIIKLLLVLAYTQMIIQQMDNRHHLKEQAELLALEHAHEPAASQCCGHRPVSGQELNQSGDLKGWFRCMWSSAKACSEAARGSGGGQKSMSSILSDFLGQVMQNVASSLDSLASKLMSFDSVLYVWCARWRSPIVQRLFQSVLIQLYYINTVLFTYD